jgi:hypothetical protein
MRGAETADWTLKSSSVTGGANIHVFYVVCKPALEPAQPSVQRASVASSPGLK